MNKTEIRIKFLKKRNALTLEERESKSGKIISSLEKSEVFRSADRILCYYSVGTEVETTGFIEKWIRQKEILLPSLSDDSSFIALPVTSVDELRPNRFDIPEPPQSGLVNPKPDLIIVPGVAFDRKGNRIGMGKGYYDRYLADKKKVLKVALAFSEQILDSVPKEPYDEAVDWIITEDELIRCKN
ncbi:5-formyltetrahydrofolate cyclo-ligase [Patescibacteria group bacterium]|nr:5-formyltetrahydrofolate cyclo-ligase [Patescibacteria group bacterium]MBU1015617.1 5-formyltetrahydrofolate cyclo-ligase [Patescibacteria group bacterium]MBU1685326.1 5-formyltetrahydrofolate cyclo-ligase [Patescibacteria group bacterium]MBU1938752.1 5-formyltetrahydrofolate cyclo-ligase [Patescibacteria group bacterium]